VFAALTAVESHGSANCRKTLVDCIGSEQNVYRRWVYVRANRRRAYPYRPRDLLAFRKQVYIDNDILYTFMDNNKSMGVKIKQRERERKTEAGWGVTCCIKRFLFQYACQLKERQHGDVS
jgi:hypothetical protein